jgi:hypothetical protein
MSIQMRQATHVFNWSDFLVNCIISGCAGLLIGLILPIGSIFGGIDPGQSGMIISVTAIMFVGVFYFFRFRRSGTKEVGNASADSGHRDEYGPSSDIRTLIDAQSRQSEADREERRRQDRRKSFREWATIILLFLAFGATVIQAIIFHGQLDEMRKVYGPIKDSADAAKNSVDISHIALISTQRAYVSANIDSIPVTEKDGALKGFAFGIRWQNKGPTRAINLQNFVMIKRFEPDVPDKFTPVMR